MGYMKMTFITETKRQLSRLLDAVRHGETVLIVHRGKPVARLVPVVTNNSGDTDGRLSRLESDGIIRRATASPSKKLLKQRPPPANWSIVQALLQDRNEEW